MFKKQSFLGRILIEKKTHKPLPRCNVLSSCIWILSGTWRIVTLTGTITVYNRVYIYIYPEPKWPLFRLEFRPCFEGLTFDYRGQLVCQATFGIPSSFNLPHFWWIQPRRCKNSLKLTAKAPENWETFLPFWKGLFSGATADGRNLAPVEVGSLSNDLQGFSTIPGGDRRISEPSTVCEF